MGRIDWRHLTNYPAVRSALVVIGFILIALTPLVGPIPGPGGKMLTAVEARRRAMPRGEDEGPWRLLMPGARVRSAADPSTAES